MAVYDHSLTYRKFKFRNIPHFFRLRKIIALIKSQNFGGFNYIDIGCSNGYITNIIGTEFNFKKIKGIDHTIENLNIGRELYPNIIFEIIDLNKLNAPADKYNLVTCLETLEHVGNIENAISTVINFAHNKNALIFISVPIETGFWGVLKFLVKSFLFNYNLEELPGKPSRKEYFKDLIKGNDISKYRDNRDGWGTHFGFDYKVIDNIFLKRKISFKAFNSFTTRFYILRNN